MLIGVSAAAVVFGRATRLARACHPAPTVAVTALTTVLFTSAGNRVSVCVVGALAILTGQLSIGWSNDLLDQARDRTAGRVDKPLVSGDVSLPTIRLAIGLAVLATIPLSLALGWPAGLLHLAAVAAGWAYNLWLKFTVASPVPYLLAFAALPVIATLAHHRQWPAGWVVLAAGLTGAAAHFANVLPDLAGDARTGVRGLPQRLGFRPSAAIAAGLTVLVAVIIVLARTRPLTVTGLAVALLLGGLTLRVRGAQAFLIVMLAAAIDVGVLVGSGGLR